MILYRTERADWLDPWGRTEKVNQIIDWVRVRPAGTIPWNNGYETNPARVAVSRFGRTFVFHAPIDYGVSGYWWEPASQTAWRQRPPKPLLDMAHNPIDPKDLPQ